MMRGWLPVLRSDFEVALRTLRARPGLATTVVLSLALAIGASASAFSVVDAVRFRALPFADADRLITISEIPVHGSCTTNCSVSFATYQNILMKRRFRTLSAITMHTSGLKALTNNGESVPVLGTLASENLFPMLRATPALGRAFTAEDNTLGAPPVTILSNELWATRFGSDPGVLGTQIQLSDTRYTIIGVMPPGFDFESQSKFWLPAIPSLDPSTRPSIRNVTVFGHLAPGATIDQARAELAGIALSAQEREAASTKTTQLTLIAQPLRERYTAAAQGYDLIFFAVVLCVVLIACVNITNLLLARGLDQRREFAVRAALGADPRQLARHVIVQHALLALIGTLVGLAFAQSFLAVIRSLAALDSFRPSGMDYRVDVHVVEFSALVATAATVVISIVPVRLVLTANAQAALRENATSGVGGEKGTQFQRMFVGVQVAFAVTLLISAGLTVRTSMRLAHVNLGFDDTQLVQTTPSLPHDWRVPERYVPAIARIEEALRRQPGVRSMTTRATNPLGNTRSPAEITLGGDASAISRALTPLSVIAVDSSYFRTMGIPMLRGRAFGVDDRAQSAPVAIVNHWAAERWWSGRDPIGAQIRIDTLPGQSITVTIVGVVADNRAGSGALLLGDDGPELYRPLPQAPSAFPTFFLRTRGSPAAVLRPIGAQLGAIVLNRPVSTVIVSESVARQLDGVLTTSRQVLAFAAIGLVLAIVGMYGVLSYSVNRRTRELGIRRALGASAPNVYRLIMRDALLVTLPGLAIGILGALWVGRFTAPLLHGTSSTDFPTFASIIVVMLLTAIGSAMLPAIRAARVSPLTAIRGS